MQDERVLVERARHKDNEAFAALYENYFDKIYRYVAFKIGNKVEAEDMTQQVFLNAFESISSFKWRDVPFSSWLFRIAHNKIVDYLRKKSRRGTVATLVEDINIVAESDPQVEAELNLDIEWLAGAAGNLTDAQREVITLRFAGELPIAQVAQIMGKSQGAVKALQHSAIVALRKLMPQGGLKNE